MSDKFNKCWIEFWNSMQSKYGNEIWQNRGLNNVQNDEGCDANRLVLKPQLMPSLLIQSLIQQLGTILRCDPYEIEQAYFKICDALYQCQLIDDSYSLEQYDIIRDEFRKMFYKLVHITNPQIDRNLIDFLSSIFDETRYCKEFEELELLGKGAFGEVFKVRHRLDDHLYAIKKIEVKLKSISDIRQDVEEVRTLAKFNHPNVVTYKDAWIEIVRLETSVETNKVSDINDSEQGTDSTINTGIEAPILNPIENCADDNQQQEHSNGHNSNDNVIPNSEKIVPLETNKVSDINDSEQGSNSTINTGIEAPILNPIENCDGDNQQQELSTAHNSNDNVTHNSEKIVGSETSAETNKVSDVNDSKQNSNSTIDNKIESPTLDAIKNSNDDNQQQEHPTGHNSKDNIINNSEKIDESSKSQSSIKIEDLMEHVIASDVHSRHIITTETSSDDTSSSSDRQDDSTTCETNKEISNAESDVVSFRNDAPSNNKTDSEPTTNQEIQGDPPNDETQSTGSSDSSKKMSKRYHTQIIYIHMALCDQTLRHWLDKRNEPTSETTFMSILKQLLDGLQYIHSKNTVHHDIKPSNIFISCLEPLTVQLGDFGLACSKPNNHQPDLGTVLYTAPEQYTGKCDAKSDIFSLGIVLIELLYPMKTGMERAHVIGDFKAGIVPKRLIVEFPKLTALIQRLTNTDPDKRPSAEELLKEIVEDKDFKIIQLTNSNNDKDSIITKLKQENLDLRAKLGQLKIDEN